MAPSLSSSATVCSSRAQRARSGETQTRATSAAGTCPSESQPPSIAAMSANSGRGSKASSVTLASLIRSRRKWRMSWRLRSYEATYQPSGPLARRYGSISRLVNSSSFSL